MTPAQAIRLLEPPEPHHSLQPPNSPRCVVPQPKEVQPNLLAEIVFDVVSRLVPRWPEVLQPPVVVDDNDNVFACLW